MNFSDINKSNKSIAGLSRKQLDYLRTFLGGYGKDSVRLKEKSSTDDKQLLRTENSLIIRHLIDWTPNGKLKLTDDGLRALQVQREKAGILISKTFQVVTNESAREGDFAKTGFEYKDRYFSFRELIDEISGCCETSNGRNPGGWSEHTWVSTEPQIEDCSTDETIGYSFHFSRKNASRKAKYWIAALRYHFRKVR